MIVGPRPATSHDFWLTEPERPGLKTLTLVYVAYALFKAGHSSVIPAVAE